MKSLRLDRWASQLQPPRNPRLYLFAQRCPLSTFETRSHPRSELQRRPNQLQTQCEPRKQIGRRRASSAATVQEQDDQGEAVSQLRRIPPNFPTHRSAVTSAKLQALHARLSLPAKLPVQTLARCLIDPSVDPRPGYNNAPLAILGQELMGYHTSEHLMCHYPRLPMSVLFAAMYAYMGPATLSALRSEWGVEIVAAPGPEVDAGLLQFKRITPGNSMAEDGQRRLKDMPQARRLGSGRENEEWNYRRGISSRIVYDDIFGDLHTDIPDRAPFQGAPVSQPAETQRDPAEEQVDTLKIEGQQSPLAHLSVEALLSQESRQESPTETEPASVEAASAGFVRALSGALYLHAGQQAVKDFVKAHILSRHLQLHTLFDFTHPTRDLARLCKREGFEPPVARLLSETGRLSRHPVFVVGVFSGNDKLGEGAGSSLNEGRVRAAAAALRSWYLYSPPDTEIVLPSDAEGASASRKPWKPQMVDMGEIVV